MIILIKRWNKMTNETIENIYPVNADLHNHIRTGSKIKEDCFNKVINAAIKRLGDYSIVGVINFDDDRYEQLINSRGYDRIDRGFYVSSMGVTLIKGQEIQ